MQKILITGFAGFIGYSLVKALRDKYKIVAFDNFSKLSNYDIKLQRAQNLGVENPETFTSAQANGVTFYRADLCDMQALEEVFSVHQFSCIINLAALTGVRQSLNHPQAYIDANVKGFTNLLECAKKHSVTNIIYASSSSVYGLNEEVPYSEAQRTDKQMSVYATSKKANELLADVYTHLYDFNMVGLRFFTVYGPWTRPDMAAMIFMKAIQEGKPLQLFNEGKMVRDFTNVQDVVKAITLLLEKMKQGERISNEVFNVGNHNPIYTIEFLQAIEKAMGKQAIVDHQPIQPGDMPVTNASTEKLYSYLGFQPNTDISEGVKEMVEWYKQYIASNSAINA